MPSGGMKLLKVFVNKEQERTRERGPCVQYVGKGFGPIVWGQSYLYMYIMATNLSFWLHHSQICFASTPNSRAAASFDFFSAVSTAFKLT